ncbi:MAG TPA: TIR domain-containing protein [Flavitalea sp.]|nr:TIR domain-containing protein [Flavitalea sp.]
MKCKIFISYRRDDTQDAVNWLYEKLKDRFGENVLFMDTGSIDPGDSWPTEIERSLEEAEVFLVLIGTQWLTKGIDEFGRRRIDNENDWVRREIEIALKSNKIIHPILVDGGKMPPSNALPSSIQLLSNKQAYELKVTAAGNSGIDNLLLLLSKTLDKNPFDPIKESLEKVLVRKYRVMKEIGSGVMTKVYLAHDSFLDRYVAIKVLQDSEHKDSFIDTIKSAAKMVEYISNSVQILEATEKDPVHVILSYLQGGTLRQKIEESEGRGLSLTEVHKQLLEIGDALVKAHEAGITHCNVKPSNIILSINGEPYLSSMCTLPKVSVRAILNKFLPENYDPEKSYYRENLCYLPPEIFEPNYFGISEKHKYEKMDQYMLGLLGYDLLAGRIPDTVSTHSELKRDGVKAFKSLEKIGNLRKECPGKLAEIIHKMTSINPGDRYPKLEDAVKEMRNVSFDAIEIAKDSYTRCISHTIPDNEFFRVFYSELIRISDEAAERFKGMGVGEEKKHRQYDMLRQAIFILFLFAEKKLGSTDPNVLSRIAETHNRSHYNISGPTYDHFVKALTNTVCGAPPTVPEAFDRHCSSNENERERIKKAWEEALSPGIEYMKKKYWEDSK